MSTPLFVTAEDAQRGFYAAFERGDFAAMAAVWLHEASVVCIHPAGNALCGWPEIERSWSAILSGGGAGRIEFEGVCAVVRAETAVFTGYELIAPAGSGVAYAPVLATNVYCRTPQGWKMTLHHASPTSQRAPKRAPAAAPTPTRH